MSRAGNRLSADGALGPTQRPVFVDFDVVTETGDVAGVRRHRRDHSLESAGAQKIVPVEEDHEWRSTVGQPSIARRGHPAVWD